MSETCAECGGTGFTLRVDASGASVASRCACSFRDRGGQLVRAAKIPRRYEHCRFEHFEPIEAGLARPLAVAREWFERWPDRIEHGLLFWGSPGTGKTHLAVAILHELAERKGARVLFAEQRELLKRLQSTFDGERSEADVLAPILEAEVLLLDDLGAGRTSAWAQDVMHDVLSHRYNRKLSTLMTTNRATGENDGTSGPSEVPTLRDRLGDALMSRLYEMCLVVPVVAGDYRRNVLHAQIRF